MSGSDGAILHIQPHFDAAQCERDGEAEREPSAFQRCRVAQEEMEHIRPAGAERRAHSDCVSLTDGDVRHATMLAIGSGSVNFPDAFFMRISASSSRVKNRRRLTKKIGSMSQNSTRDAAHASRLWAV